ncbi:MAG: CHASE3 domain-containing protein [Vicinamibacterales bacterium]|nr:CHASE3 domain-containing protein [Vicinamibacterales bacterium]
MMHRRPLRIRLRVSGARVARWWADRPVATKGLFVVALPLVSLLGLLLCVAALILVERRVDTASTRMNAAAEATEALLVGLLNAETGVRGYLLTGDPGFLQPYHLSARVVSQSLTALQILVDDEALAVPFGNVQRLVSARQAQWAEQVESRRDSPAWSAAIRQHLDEGRPIMDELRLSLADMRSLESRRVSDLLARRAQLRSLQWVLLLVGLFAGLAGGTASATLFLTGIARRIKGLEAAARDVEAGRLPATTDARGSDEIGRVALALRRANRLLRRREEALRQSAARVQDLYDRAPCGYHSLDAQGTFIEVNQTELAWLGRSHDDLVGRLKFPDILTPASRALFAERFPRFLREGHIDDVEFDLMPANGVPRPVSLTATAIRDAEGRYIASRSTMFDITERRRADEARQVLSQRVAAALAEQQALNRELEAFSYSVSHDLRAPLRSLDGFSQVLLEDYGDRLDDEGRHYLARIRAGAQRLGMLIDDLLELARVTRATLEPRPVDLTGLARGVIDELTAPNDSRRVDWIVAEHLHANGDRVLLRMLLQNLLGNAWKFTAPAANARIEFGAQRHGDAQTFFVRDNGAGFDMQYAEKLFGVFQRLHTTQEFPGTGVGLATVQRIVHKHGGKVWAEGAPGAGATFWFTLSRDETAHGQEHPS